MNQYSIAWSRFAESKYGLEGLFNTNEVQTLEETIRVLNSSRTLNITFTAYPHLVSGIKCTGSCKAELNECDTVGWHVPRRSVSPDRFKPVNTLEENRTRDMYFKAKWQVQ